MTPFFPSSSFIVPTPDPNYIESIKRRRDVIRRLCSTLDEYLGGDLDDQIERLTVAQKPPAVTVEMLIDAQKSREGLQSQIDALLGLINEVPKAQVDYLKSMQMEPLQSSLKHQDEYISKLQAQLEKQG